MIAKLRQTLELCERPASLCWYGDHVPIMPSVYETLGAPNGKVEFIIWNNQNPVRSRAVDLSAHDLPMAWLRGAGLVELR